MQEVYKWLSDNKNELMNKFIYKMVNNKNNAEDFYQDLFIIMSDKDEKKMLEILNRGEMFAYIYIIIKNNLRSNTSRYYYTYRKPQGYEYNEIMDYRESYDNNKDELLKDIEESYTILNNKIRMYLELEGNNNVSKYYQKEIFFMYYSDNEDITYRKMGEKLDIPYVSIFNTVSSMRKKIEKKFKKDIENIKSKLIYYYNNCDNNYVYGEYFKINKIDNDN